MYAKQMTSVELVATIRELQALEGLRAATLGWLAECECELAFRNELSVYTW